MGENVNASTALEGESGEALLLRKAEKPIWERFSFYQSDPEPQDGYILQLATSSETTTGRR